MICESKIVVSGNTSYNKVYCISHPNTSVVILLRNSIVSYQAE